MAGLVVSQLEIIVAVFLDPSVSFKCNKRSMAVVVIDNKIKENCGCIQLSLYCLVGEADDCNPEGIACY